MKNNTPVRWTLSRWITLPIGMAVAIPLVYILNQPSRIKFQIADRELAAAGYPDARVNRAQMPSNMHRCGVGQIRNKGSAYAWETDTHSGVFCLPDDGHRSTIIVNE